MFTLFPQEHITIRTPPFLKLSSYISEFSAFLHEVLRGNAFLGDHVRLYLCASEWLIPQKTKRISM